MIAALARRHVTRVCCLLPRLLLPRLLRRPPHAASFGSAAPNAAMTRNIGVAAHIDAGKTTVALADPTPLQCTG